MSERQKWTWGTDIDCHVKFTWIPFNFQIQQNWNNFCCVIITIDLYFITQEYNIVMQFFLY